jgi:hypothetical protein
MVLQSLTRKLAKKEKEIFEKYGLVYLPEAVTEMFDPFSITSNPAKTFWLGKNVVARLYPDAKIEIEKVTKSEYIPEALAEVLTQNETPHIPVALANIYDTKLEADLNRKPITEMPEKLEVEGAILSYGANILETLILTIIEKLQKIKPGASETDIINALTTPPPTGTGWLKLTPKLSTLVKQKLEQLVWKGIITYNPQTMMYNLTRKPTTSTIRTE